MTNNKEKGPESLGSEETAEEGTEAEEMMVRAETRASGLDILKGALGEIESQEDMRQIEDEAYAEEEKRERYEETKQKEQEVYEQTLERCYGEGAATYMAFKTAEEFRRLSKERRLDHATTEQVIQESLKYLELLGYENDYHFKQYIDNAGFNARGVYLLFGPFTHKMESDFNKEGYFEEMKKVSQILDRIWEKRGEELMVNEISALREKRERQAIVRHLEGFGTTALEHGDVDTAVDAFIEGDLVGNPEIAEKVAEKIKEMIQSKEPEVRAKALAAKKSLDKFFERKAKEERERE